MNHFQYRDGLLCAESVRLDRLAEAGERQSRVMEMRFFGGLSVEETAAVLGVSPNTVIRDWDFARAWLRRELKDTGNSSRGSLATH